MAHVYVVYAHPGRGFTREVLDAFLLGLDGAGHTHTVADLYAMGFRPELSLAEYQRESTYDTRAPVPDDVAAQHARLDAADAWAFVYPVWWTDCPAILKGWFDRVWTVGFRERARARYALVLCTAGHPVDELGPLYGAMREVMLTDRIAGRAERSEFVLLGGTLDRSEESRRRHLARARELGAIPT